MHLEHFASNGILTSTWFSFVSDGPIRSDSHFRTENQNILVQECYGETDFVLSFKRDIQFIVEIKWKRDQWRLREKLYFTRRANGPISDSSSDSD